MIVPTLIVTGGPLDGTSFEVDDSPRDRLVGSSSDCDLQILLGNVEPVHAKLSRGPRGLLLADGGSATGTYVNGEKIEGDCLLQDGDRICLGPPGSKSSAKIIVKLPPGGAALPLDATRPPSAVSHPVLAAPDQPLS
ncbi:MAG TPA: FHA domain-containing protein, partial [Vicinamibacteria bacterium]|nr:FHA domain-containing protein [Vicinamibacteria bacterium]